MRQGKTSYCAMNQLSVMNAWFQKKTMHFGTWNHKAGAHDRLSGDKDITERCCTDVQAMRGDNCWSDHNLVRANLSFGMPRMHNR